MASNGKTVNIPQSSWEKLKLLASRERRSMGQQIAYLIEQAIKKIEEPKKAG